jgi:adenosylhomocysteine nucleosidase
MSDQPLIVMALEGESQGKLEACGFNVLYCGVGKVNAAYHLTRRLHELARDGIRVPYVLNLGSAGSHRFATGSLVEIDRFVQRDMDAVALGFAYGETPFDPTPATLTVPRRFPHLPAGVCGSGDSFVEGAPPIPCDVVEMEAFALAKVCLHEKIAFACIKYITDGADGNASRDWQQNLADAAQAFCELLNASR